MLLTENSVFVKHTCLKTADTITYCPEVSASKVLNFVSKQTLTDDLDWLLEDVLLLAHGPVGLFLLLSLASTKSGTSL